MFMGLLSSVLEDYMTGNGGMNAGMMENMGEAWMEQIAAQLMDQYQPTSFPTAARIVSALPTYDVRPRSSKGEPGPNESFACAGEPCSVCHDEFIEKSKVVELCCSHCFHGACIKPWLKTHNTCPVCRIELETEEDS
jgi:Ring finger domain